MLKDRQANVFTMGVSEPNDIGSPKTSTTVDRSSVSGGPKRYSNSYLLIVEDDVNAKDSRLTFGSQFLKDGNLNFSNKPNVDEGSQDEEGSFRKRTLSAALPDCTCSRCLVSEMKFQTPPPLKLVWVDESLFIYFFLISHFVALDSNWPLFSPHSLNFSALTVGSRKTRLVFRNFAKRTLFFTEMAKPFPQKKKKEKCTWRSLQSFYRIFLYGTTWSIFILEVL